MTKCIRNTNAIARQLGSALISTSNYKLEVARKKEQKIEEIVEKRKVKAMATKQRRARRKIKLSSEEEDESNTGDNIDPD